MTRGRTDAEKAQMLMLAGVAGTFAARFALKLTEGPAQLGVIAGWLVALVVFCFGVSRVAISRGRSPAWGFAGFVGFVVVYYLLEPKVAPAGPRRIPPPPPPPGYVPTR